MYLQWLSHTKHMQCRKHPSYSLVHVAPYPLSEQETATTVRTRDGSLAVGSVGPKPPENIPKFEVWLVVLTMLKNDGVRQWEGWHPVYEMENKPFMFQSPLEVMDVHEPVHRWITNWFRNRRASRWSHPHMGPESRPYHWSYAFISLHHKHGNGTFPINGGL